MATLATKNAPRQSARKRSEIGDALTGEIQRRKFETRLTFTRAERKRAAKPARLIAYDFETDRIAAGTPRPLYLTAYSDVFALETPVRDMQHLRAVLETQFLTDDNIGVKFVAWNGNRFDAYFVAAALLYSNEYTLRPYMTKSKALRGLRVSKRFDVDGKPYSDPKHAPSWEFLDGIAMLGLVGVSLQKLLDNFAPDYAKLTGAIDWEREQFDPRNPKHCEYAMRDSVGLWHAMTRAQQIMIDTFNQPLTVTMGGACIKILQANMPRGVEVEPLEPDALATVREFVMRGGFCYCVRRYDGPVWKYDINQAYAAAMRDADLPCGPMLRISGTPSDSARCFIARIEARNPTNKIPFYHRSEVNGRVRSLFSVSHIPETWITSIEYRQLQAEGWAITCREHWRWAGAFSLTEYVDKLETLRVNAEGGPSGPIGTMVKATGNHSYGKTVENVEPIEYALGAECPPDMLPFYDDGFQPLTHVFYKIDIERRPKAYHQPQLGAFITAQVRMVLRRAALIDPDAWLYADTDCVVFSRDVTASLDIHAKRYGAWKIEEEGTRYQIIAKKVYAEVGGDKPKRSAKGMNVKRLTADDFARWYEGAEPEQVQIQINNFLAVLSGAEMYRSQVRKGTRVEAEKTRAEASAQA